MPNLTDETKSPIQKEISLEDSHTLYSEWVTNLSNRTRKILDNRQSSFPKEGDFLHAIANADEEYEFLLPLYSVRTNHVLEDLQATYENKQEFLYAFVQMPPKKIAGLKNCGRKTVQEILEIQESLIGVNTILASIGTGHENMSIPSNVDTLLPLVLPRLDYLTVRAKNAVISLLKENNNSLSQLYSVISRPDFKPKDLKNVGKGTVLEIRMLLDGIQEYLESFADEQSVQEAVVKFNTPTLDNIHIPTDSQSKIEALQTSLNHFPLFAALKAHIAGMDNESNTIFEGCIRSHPNQEMPNRNEVAAKVGLSSERVRQKCNKILESISKFLKRIQTLGVIKNNPYTYLMTHVEADINASEGTDFSLNFVNWVLASTFDEVTLLGDPLKTLSVHSRKEFFLALVPTDLCSFMDFPGFLADIETLLAKKRTDEQKVSLKSLIEVRLKKQYCEDKMTAIEIACRSILFLHYPVDVDFGQVILHANTRKNNPLIVEDILRAAGHPMTLEELHEEFIYQYPERYTELNSFRSSVSNNHNIIPIGRTSTYTLAEWEGDHVRGGSIRQFVSEYLDNLDEPIALVSDIVEYVRRFRPNTSESSISSNLLQESHHRFIILVKEGDRYIGYSDKEYDAAYHVVGGLRPMKRSTSESMQLLAEFILEYGRYPYGTEVDEEEARLYRFVGNRRSACARNVIPGKEIEEWRQFEEKYREYDIPRLRKRRSRKTIGE